MSSQIDDVRTFLKDQPKQQEQNCNKTSHALSDRVDDPGPSLLFGSTKSTCRAEVLSQLPSKYSCDIFVNRFFAHLYPAVRQFACLLNTYGTID